MEAVVAILGLFLLLCVVIGVYATVKVVKAAKRGVDRTVTQARRTVEDTRLRAKQYTQVGPGAEIAELRMSLRTSMRATRQALDTATTEDASLSESRALFERLSTHGHDVDDDLRRLEAEPDRNRVAARLPELRKRTERVTHSADSLRWAVQDRAGHFAEDDLAGLSDQIQMEATALRHWRSEHLAEDTDRTPFTAGSTAAPFGAGDPTRPSNVSGTPGAPDGGWPGTNTSAFEPLAGESAATVSGAGADTPTTDDPEPAEGPRALTADPRLRKSYPWQRSARPENTT
ncbi:hypothetical protein [Streptomyces sp. NPDC057702]|uniref:hypothetical protein n=1 Tax=unclassified Streptomyces TaxID=2593676 RepID=UPI0036B41462